MSTSRKPSPTLPALDLVTIRREAIEWVEERLAQAPDEAGTVMLATKIIEEQDKPVRRLKLQRDAVALSIREYGPDATEPVQRQVRNVRLAEAAGISRPRLQTLRNQIAGQVPLVDNARRELPRLARRCAQHEQRVEHARRKRDEAVFTLFSQGWKNADIARLMGRDASRAAHLRSEWLKTNPEHALAS